MSVPQSHTKSNKRKNTQLDSENNVKAAETVKGVGCDQTLESTTLTVNAIPVQSPVLSQASVNDHKLSDTNKQLYCTGVNGSVNPYNLVEKMLLSTFTQHKDKPNQWTNCQLSKIVIPEGKYTDTKIINLITSGVDKVCRLEFLDGKEKQIQSFVLKLLISKPMLYIHTNSIPKPLLVDDGKSIYECDVSQFPVNHTNTQFVGSSDSKLLFPNVTLTQDFLCFRKDEKLSFVTVHWDRGQIVFRYPNPTFIVAQLQLAIYITPKPEPSRLPRCSFYMNPSDKHPISFWLNLFKLTKDTNDGSKLTTGTDTTGVDAISYDNFESWYNVQSLLTLKVVCLSSIMEDPDMLEVVTQDIRQCRLDHHPHCRKYTRITYN